MPAFSNSQQIRAVARSGLIEESMLMVVQTFQAPRLRCCLFELDSVDYVYVRPGTQRSTFNGRLMEREQSLEETLHAARKAETSTKHMKSLKEENSIVENVDVVGRKGQKSQWAMPCGNCSIPHAPASCPAAGRRCHKRRKMSHFSRMCRGPEGAKEADKYS